MTKRSTIRIAPLLAGMAFALGANHPSPAHGATTSKELLACQVAFEKNVRSLVSYTAGKLQGCTERVLRCKLANEIDGADLPSCLATTATLCNGVSTKVSDQQATRVANILLKCGLVPIADVEAFVAGLGFFNVAGGCGAATVSDLATCVAAASRCNAERAVFRLDPRATDSLTTAGIDGSFPCAAP
jgi:hypothetical protein